jgi:hypothetical protein
MAYERSITTHHRPYFSPPVKYDSLSVDEETVATLSREEAARDMAYLAALNRETSVLNEPELPENFAQSVADLDQRIYERGVAFDGDKILSLGRERFQGLLWPRATIAV